MPPRTRYTRDDLLSAALALVRRDGMDALNARSLAHELGCSTQPLFREFDSMAEIKQEVYKRAFDVYSGYINESMSWDMPKYKSTGMAYIRFARDEPELFKLLFMRDRVSEGQYSDQTNFDLVFNIIKKETPLDDETALRFFERTWLFIHGLAVCIATKYIPCQDERYLISMVKEAYNAAVKMMNLEGVLKLQEI